MTTETQGIKMTTRTLKENYRPRHCDTNKDRDTGNIKDDWGTGTQL